MRLNDDAQRACSARDYAAQPAIQGVALFADVQFQAAPADCDEGRLPRDLAGAGVCDVVRG
jgi:hypothetical protein